MEDLSQGRIFGERATFGFQKTHVSMLGEFVQHLAVHRLRLPLRVSDPQHGTSSYVPTHMGGAPQIPASQSVDSIGKDVTTEKKQTASLGEESVYKSNVERCCQIHKPWSQKIGIPVLLLHQSRTTAIDKSEVLRRPLLDHSALKKRREAWLCTLNLIYIVEQTRWSSENRIRVVQCRTGADCHVKLWNDLQNLSFTSIPK